MWIESDFLDSGFDWLNPKTQKWEAEPVLYNIQHYKQIYVDHHITENENFDYWYIAIGEAPYNGSLGDEGEYIEIARFNVLEDAITEFQKIVAALKAGQNYYKIGEDNG